MRRNSGLTLIEVLLYVSIVSGFVISLFYLITSIEKGSNKSKAMAEVNSNVRFVSSKLQYYMRNADTVTSVSENQIHFEMASGSYSIYKAANQIVLFDGTEEHSLTSNTVITNSLAFKKTETPGISRSVTAEFEISYVNPANLPEYAVTQENMITVTLRP